MKKGYSPMMYVHIIITLFLMFGFGFIPPFATLTPMGMRLLGTFLGVIYGYSTCEIIWPSLFAFIAYGLCRHIRHHGKFYRVPDHHPVFYRRRHCNIWFWEMVHPLVPFPEGI